MGSIILATVLIASLSLLGVAIFGGRGHLVGTHRFIVPFAIGTFLGITFLELIPSTLAGSATYGPFAILGGFLAFYLLAHSLQTYHHHHHGHVDDDHCDATKSSAVLLLIGDAVHNFVDGVVIASAFLLNPIAGWTVAFGVALHEAPQEIAEYGVLRAAGYSRGRAAAYNFLSASAVVVGAVVTVVFVSSFSHELWILTGVAAGNLLYVAMSDLIPGVHASARSTGHFLRAFVATALGIAVIATFITWSHARFGHHGDAHDSHAPVEGVPALGQDSGQGHSLGGEERALVR